MPVIRTPEHRPEGCCAPANDTLKLTTVRSRLLTPGGMPMAGREVVAVLRASPNWLADRSGRVVDTAKTRTDSEGWWRMKLVPNQYLEASLDETGEPHPTSYYEIKEEALVSAARVPAPGGHDSCPDPESECTVYLRDILIDPPTPPAAASWHPIDTLGALHNVDRGADTTQVGYALMFDGRLWVPGPVTSTNELARLTDMHPSIASAVPGDMLEAIDYDPVTGRVRWGVDRTVPDLSMEFGGASGDMTVYGEITTPETTTQDVQVFWHGDATGPTSTIPAGEYEASHTFTAPGEYGIYYQYADESAWGTSPVTIPLP